MKILYKLLRDSYNTVLIKNKSSFQKNKLADFKYKLDLFVIRFFYGNTFFRNKIKAKISNNKILSNNLVNNTTTFDVLEDLNKKGHSKILKLNDDIFKEIENDVLKNTEVNSIIKFDGKVYEEKSLKFDDLSSLNNYLVKKDIYLMKNEININSLQKFKNFFTNNFFLEIARSYLNTNKLSMNASLFATNNDSGSLLGVKKLLDLKNKSAQSYHFDVDYKKFFKIILYFTNVNYEEDGAHVYIPGTHINKLKRHIVTDRFNDEDIENSYKKKKIFIGTKGSFFFVDTFGIHKGAAVKNNFRVAMIIEYGKDHFKYSNNTIFL